MPEREEKSLLKNTVEEERLRVRRIVRNIGSKISGLMITCGFLVSAFGLYILVTPQDPNLSLTLKIIFTGALGFIGSLNVLCGLLLLLGED
ncbi:MAG: hypothetical protein QXJ63_03380 [Candidatus Bathyarchaeia archaeon]